MNMPAETDNRYVEVHYFLSEFEWQKERFNRKAGFKWLGAKRLVVKLWLMNWLGFAVFLFYNNHIFWKPDSITR
jgi:hypothetical protein